MKHLKHSRRPRVEQSRSGTVPGPDLHDLLPLHGLLQALRGVETLLKIPSIPAGSWALIDPSGRMTVHPDVLTLFIDAKHNFKPKA